LKPLNKTDRKIYLAILHLLKEGKDVTIPHIAECANITKGLIYYKINNIHLYLKEK